MIPETKSNPTTCANCGTEILDAFCGKCGQPSKVKRITFVSLMADFQVRLLGFDTSFLRTVKDLTIRPGRVGRAFVDGNRVKYFKPVGYFVVMLTIFLVLISFSPTWQEVIKVSQETQSSSGNAFELFDDPKVRQVLAEGALDNMRILTFLQIPFVGIWAMVFFRSEKLNFWEHMVGAFYFNGQALWLNVLTIILLEIVPAPIALGLGNLSFIYLTWASMLFYQKGGKFMRILKGLFTYIMAYVTYGAAMVLGMVIYAKYIY